MKQMNFTKDDIGIVVQLEIELDAINETGVYRITDIEDNPQNGDFILFKNIRNSLDTHFTPITGRNYASNDNYTIVTKIYPEEKYPEYYL